MDGAHDAFKDSARLTPEYGGGYVGYLWFSHQMHVCAHSLPSEVYGS